MLSGLLSNAVVAKIRAMMKTRITPAQYREIMSKHNVAEVTMFLQSSTRYSEALAGVQPYTVQYSQLEYLLRLQRYIEYAKLMRFVPREKRSFYEFFIAPAEIEQILRMISLINDGTPEQFIARFPRYIDPYVSVDFDKVSQARDFNGLLDALQGTRYHARLEPFRFTTGGKVDYARCDSSLFSQYYNLMYKIIDQQFSGKTRQNLNRVYGVTVQLRNMVIIYRIKSSFPDTAIDDLQFMLIPMRNRTARKEINSLLDAPNADALAEELKRSQFGKYFEDFDFEYVEYHEYMILYDLVKRLLYSGESAPVCFLAYMNLCTIEINNLIRIIESINYSLPSVDIEKLLIMDDERSGN